MERRDSDALPFGVAYSTYMERPRLSRAISRIVFGGDTKRYYESMAAIDEVAHGGTIVTARAGPGRRCAPFAQTPRFATSPPIFLPSMLRRARKRAASRGLGSVEFIEADATDLPLVG